MAEQTRDEIIQKLDEVLKHLHEHDIDVVKVEGRLETVEKGMGELQAWQRDATNKFIGAIITITVMVVGGLLSYMFQHGGLPR